MRSFGSEHSSGLSVRAWRFAPVFLFGSVAFCGGFLTPVYARRTSNFLRYSLQPLSVGEARIIFERKLCNICPLSHGVI